MSFLKIRTYTLSTIRDELAQAGAFLMAEGKVRCPECEKSFTRRGLNGHLRFAHGTDPKEAKQIGVEAKPIAGDEVFEDEQERVLVLADRLRDIQEKKAWLKQAGKAEKDDFFNWGDPQEKSLAPETVEVALRALEKVETEVNEKLQELQPAEFQAYWNDPDPVPF